MTETVEISNNSCKLLQKLVKTFCDERSKIYLTKDMTRMIIYSISPENSVIYFSTTDTEIENDSSESIEELFQFEYSFIRDALKLAGSKGKIKLTYDNSLKIVEAKSGSKSLAWNADRSPKSIQNPAIPIAISMLENISKEKIQLVKRFPDFHIKNSPGQSLVFKDVSGIFEDSSGFYSTNCFSLFVTSKQERENVGHTFWPQIFNSIIDSKNPSSMIVDGDMLHIYSKQYSISLKSSILETNSNIFDKSKTIDDGISSMFEDPSTPKCTILGDDLFDRIDLATISSFDATMIRLSLVNNELSISLYKDSAKINLSIDSLPVKFSNFDILITEKDFSSLLFAVEGYSSLSFLIHGGTFSCKFGEHKFICTYSNA